MSETRCGCCHTTLWTDSETNSGVCEECLRISRNPERYRNDPEIDVRLVVRKVASALHARGLPQFGTLVK